MADLPKLVTATVTIRSIEPPKSAVAKLRLKAKSRVRFMLGRSVFYRVVDGERLETRTTADTRQAGIRLLKRVPHRR